jgi:putative transposase
LSSLTLSGCARLPYVAKQRWPRGICFCVSSWPYSESATRKLRPQRPGIDLCSPNLLVFSTGASALVIVKPATVIGWHRAAFRRFWRWKSRPVGRPPVKAEMRRLIWRIAAENPTWGEERIADELLLKTPDSAFTAYGGQIHQTKATGLTAATISAGPLSYEIDAHVIVACDFFVAVTARFRILYIFVALEIGSRRLVHFNVTEHPTADWTLQQLREALPGDGHCKFLLHDRHSTFSASLDEQVESWGIRVLRSPVRMPTANAHCERLIGSIRRECLDYVIPLHALHLRRLLREWVRHYNTGRPHRSLGPGIPEQAHHRADPHKRANEPCRASGVIAKPILGGLHHEYRWENAAA